MSKEEEETVEWLNDVLSFINKENPNLLNQKIYPNQNGQFCNKEILYFEQESIDEKLKKISYHLGYDFKDELIDKRVNIVLPTNRGKTSKDIALKIETLIKERLSQIPRSSKTKEIARELLHWFSNNKHNADNFFNHLYNNRHILREDSEVIEDMEKADMLDKIIKKSGIQKEKIEEIINNDGALILSVNKDLYPQEDEISMSLGLTDNSDEMSRITINEEAREMILNDLKNNGFIVSDNINIKHTIVSGILRPDGHPVKIVIKSAKAGKIYFNPNEWLALSETDSQLFAITKGNNVQNITYQKLEEVNDTFHMRFNTQAFSANTNLKIFADFFKELPYTHFIFDVPEKLSDYFEEFGLNKASTKPLNEVEDDISMIE